MRRAVDCGSGDDHSFLVGTWLRFLVISFIGNFRPVPDERVHIQAAFEPVRVDYFLQALGVRRDRRSGSNRCSEDQDSLHKHKRPCGHFSSPTAIRQRSSSHRRPNFRNGWKADAGLVTQAHSFEGRVRQNVKDHIDGHDAEVSPLPPIKSAVSLHHSTKPL